LDKNASTAAEGELIPPEVPGILLRRSRMKLTFQSPCPGFGFLSPPGKFAPGKAVQTILCGPSLDLRPPAAPAFNARSQ